MPQKPEFSFVLTTCTVKAKKLNQEEIEVLPGTVARIIAYGEEHFRVQFCSRVRYHREVIQASILRSQCTGLVLDLPLSLKLRM